MNKVEIRTQENNDISEEITVMQTHIKTEVGEESKEISKQLIEVMDENDALQRNHASQMEAYKN